VNEIVPPVLGRILTGTNELERAYLVGGCVRDWLLRQPVKDFDIEVFGVELDQLAAVLGRWGRVDLVGRSFGVIKLTVGTGETYDFALPRRDSKVGAGHKGFQVECEPNLPPRDAAARRDFTVNSLMYDLRKRKLLDFFAGESDLSKGILRHTSPAFVEDPLRVLRGMQFAGRFGFTLAAATAQLCGSIVGSYSELAIERVREEWLKWASRSRQPSYGLRCLAESGWLRHFPEIQAMMGVEQDSEWHPEGDVWIHTGHCLDALAASPEWRDAAEPSRWALTFAVLLHDTGKAATTLRELRGGRDRVVSPGHENISARLAETFLARLGMMADVVQRVVPLVANHMVHAEDPTPRAVRRLAVRLHPATITELATVMIADASGRPPLPQRTPPGVDALLKRAAELDLESQRPTPILLGRHLLARGRSPGPALGVILKEAFEAQLDGQFQNLDEALDQRESPRSAGYSEDINNATELGVIPSPQGRG
jgi:tRNA nucleotidyltransferase (CCA-adding enzyme)